MKEDHIFWLDEGGLQRAYAPLRESVQVITQKHDLDADWLNYLAQMLLFDEVNVPDGKLWKRFGPLHVYAPASEYILAFKITAGRQKDLDDCAILLPKTKIRTRQQAQQVLDRHREPPPLPATIDTMAYAYQRICQGEDPWTALGDFSNAWYGYAEHIRPDLVKDPLIKPEQEAEGIQRWAAFCAASVEYLCGLHHQLCPAWVHDSSYILDTPWWYTQRADDPTIREHTRRTTPPPFARRNIFCSNRLYQNKYELYEWIGEAIGKGMTDVHEIQRYARQKEISLYGA